MKKERLIEVVAAMLILLFMYTAISKLLDYGKFALELSKSPFITAFAATIAWALPAGEIAVAMALSFRRTRLVGLYASLFLMTMFTAYIYAMLNLSYYVPCSCGGILSNMGWHTHFWFNMFFVVISFWATLVEVRPDTEAGETENLIIE